MADPVVVSTVPNPQTLVIPQYRNPGVVQLLGWDGTPISSSNPLVLTNGVYGRIDNTPTIQNAQYVSGNDMGGLISLTLPGTGGGLLQSVAIQFIGGATTVCVAYLFDSNPTASIFTDKSTFTIAAADEVKRINKNGYSLTPVAQTGDTVTGAAVDNLAKPFNATGTIYLALCAGGTFTPTSVSDLRVSITYFQNSK